MTDLRQTRLTTKPPSLISAYEKDRQIVDTGLYIITLIGGR